MTYTLEKKQNLKVDYKLYEQYSKESRSWETRKDWEAPQTEEDYGVIIPTYNVENWIGSWNR